MLFSSLEFLYLFLPLVVIIYLVIPWRVKNAWLLLTSLLFYAYGEIKLLWVMLLAVIANFVFGRAVDVAKRKKAVLWAAVIFNVGLLAFFKYTDFFLENIGVSPLGIALPLGISFYIFQAMSYVLDVYRHETEPQKSLVRFGTYVTMFPQLVAGPIVRYSDVARELEKRSITLQGISQGLRIFAVGLAKKVLLANTAGEMREIFLGAGAGYLSVASEWMALICFAFQIYYDFGGYSDMAVGLGRIFGFEFPKNFDYPYVSRSITEFWRRWHITLSTWFREYVYIPLGGNRCSRGRMYFNLFVTWALTGIWHGAEWCFVIWGVYFFALLALEKAFLGKLLPRLPRFLCHAYALFFILLGWQIFTSDGAGGLAEGFARMGRLFGIGADSLIDGFAAYEILRHGVILLVMAIGVTSLPRSLAERLGRRSAVIREIAVNIFLPVSLLLSTAALAGASYNPFLYFRF